MYFIRNQLSKENKEFVATWIIKRQVGFIRYFVIGTVRCALFLIMMYLVKSLIDWKSQFDLESVLSIIIASLLLPLISWGVNEFRYKRTQR